MDNAAFMDDFFCQVGVATAHGSPKSVDFFIFFSLNVRICVAD